MTLSELGNEFTSILRRIGGPRARSARVEFYPYTRLTNAVRLRDGHYEVRLSDILEQAPSEVVISALSVLAFKILNRPVPPEVRQPCQSYVARPEVRSRIREVRRTRGRKHLVSPVGKVFDLKHLYDELNASYFSGRLAVRHLSWSRRKNRRSLGHFDAAHNAIIINRRLDSHLVPKYVVSYLVFHEMLHAHFGEEYRNGRRNIHHAAFRKAERSFRDYRKATRFIREFFRS